MPWICIGVPPSVQHIGPTKTSYYNTPSPGGGGVIFFYVASIALFHEQGSQGPIEYAGARGRARRLDAQLQARGERRLGWPLLHMT
jgi:hypothetical protein